ncbi:MAG: prenyltransferase/squalene oxidase repeat-containing protein, partial [Isosphaeraceae bacterium]
MMKRVFLYALLAVSTTAAAPAREPARQPLPGKIARPTANEPKASSFSMRQAALFLDATTVQWVRERKCGSCHSSYPYLLARPTLREFSSSAPSEIRGFFEQRVAHWDDGKPDSKPKYDAEVISTAEALAVNDALSTGALHPLSRRALDRVWTLQKADGGFKWIKCGWAPLEYDDYYGAVVAALGAGYAPGDYAKATSARAGLDRLRGYFRKNPPPSLHHQTMLLWASTRLEGVMTSEQKEQTVKSLRALQRGDGGWCLPSLGHWKRRDGTPNDPQSPSDGYATGLVVFVLRQAGVPAADPAVERGVSWLKTNQRVSGRWFTRSLNDDVDHYIADAGTSFAVLA